MFAYVTFLFIDMSFLFMKAIVFVPFTFLNQFDNLPKLSKLIFHVVFVVGPCSKLSIDNFLSSLNM